jgi:hypothetical protein
MTAGQRIDSLVSGNDLDGLVELAGALAFDGDWAGLIALRDKARRAADVGRQLWPAAAMAEYRLALDAPGEWAARVLDGEAGRLAPGPLTEVAASTKTWAELAPHVPAGPARAYVAHERVVRGEDLRGDASIPAEVLDMPLVRFDWEPDYAVAEYGPDGLVPAELADPLAGGDVIDLRDEGAEEIGDPEAIEALRECVAPWMVSSNGRAAAVCVEGAAVDAIAALGVPKMRINEITGADALALIAATSASGGAHGRRRGMAFGRFHAWWTAVALMGEIDDWPLDPADIAAGLDRLRWWRWDDGAPSAGWSFRLAVTDPDDGLSWAIQATDHRDDVATPR